MIISILIGVIMALASWLFVMNGLVHEVIFRKLGSKRTFLAWLPIANYYELAILTRDENNQTKVFGQYIDIKLFRFWYVAMSAAMVIPVVGGIIGIVIQVVCLGTCYARAFAILEDRPVSEFTTTGYLCGAIPLIVIFKYKHIIDSEPESMYKTSKYDIQPMQFNQGQQMYNTYGQQPMQQGYNPNMQQQGFVQQPQQNYNQYGQGVVPPQQVTNMQFDTPNIGSDSGYAEEFNTTADMF